MLHLLRCIATLAAALAGASAASAAPCAFGAMGVSRVITVSAREQPFVGSLDYHRPLPLAPGEVVLTFDDGPQPPFTNAVLRALAQECLRATFFMVGRQAAAYPDMVRQIYAAGHTIGTHTQTHPLYRMPPDYALQEIDTGFASVQAALRVRGGVAPYFRFPGLFRVPEAERYLYSRSIVTWSIDIDSDDWRRGMVGDEMLRRTLGRIEANRGGVVLMHDVQPVTALMLPRLLAELKSRGYRIVHAVPSGGMTGAPMAAAPAPAVQPPQPVAAAPAMVPVQSTQAPVRREAMDAFAAPTIQAEPQRARPAGPFERLYTPDGRMLYR